MRFSRKLTRLNKKLAHKPSFHFIRRKKCNVKIIKESAFNSWRSYSSEGSGDYHPNRDMDPPEIE